MDRNDASGHPYASHPYATPQSDLPGTSTNRSQYAAAGHLPSTQVTPQYTHTPQVSHPQSSSSGGHYETPGSAGRFRGFEQSPTGLGIAGRAGEAGSYGFTPASHYATGYPLPAQALQYQPDARRQDTPQYHQTFTAEGMYVGPQVTTQALAQPTYAQVTQHGQRSVDTPGQFAGASHYGLSSSSSSQFYMPGPSIPSNTPSANLPASNLQFGQAEFPVTQPQSHSAFATPIVDSTQPAMGISYGSISHQQPTPHAASAMQVDLDRQEFDNHLRTIFSCVQRGDLSNVDEHLLAASSYLLLNIEPLRLHLDPENPNDERNRQLREQRVREWDLFNWAWLSVLQRQLDATRHAFHSGRDPHVTVMTIPTLELLGSELVRLCDGVEKYGLVDYQAGVAEDEIIDLILRCLAVLETDPIAAVTASSSAGSVSAMMEPRHHSH